MSIRLNDAGTWKLCSQPYANDAGVWKPAQQVWVNNAGTWKQAWPGPFDSYTVTSGLSGSAPSFNQHIGFQLSVLGSVNPTTSAMYGEAQVEYLIATQTASSFDTNVGFLGTFANSGWTSVNINGTILNRAAANTFDTSGGITRWVWTSTGNLFGGAGSTIPVTFT